MNTITPGTVTQPVEPWWVGKTVKCHECKFEGTLESSDPITEVTDGRTMKNHAHIQCPTIGCGHYLTAHEE